LSSEKNPWWLYLVTDEREDDLVRVEAALRGGVTAVQLRKKRLSDWEFEEKAYQLQELCKKYQVPFIINDRVEIASRVCPDAVHIGQEDLSLPKTKKLLPKNTLIGVSVSNVEEARVAEQQGASYLGVGAIFPTTSKPDAKIVSLETVKAIRATSQLPIVLIGGIQENNISLLPKGLVDGFAVISAILSAADPEKAARKLREKVDQYFL
jgi:thiamine-phosphate pyrophosphorylase